MVTFHGKSRRTSISKEEEMRKAFTLVEVLVVIAILGILTALCMTGCEMPATKATPVATTGVKKVTAKVNTQSNGLTVEQENVKRRIEQENTPGSTKHLYIVSAYSGEIILYSPVKGKVTSSGKRLTPYEVAAGSFGYGQYSTANDGIPVNIGGTNQLTSEVLQDDGTYGSSTEYLYWWDLNDVFHQQYVTGGMIVHISDQPQEFGTVTLRMKN